MGSVKHYKNSRNTFQSMSEILADIAIPPQFPDHTQLPESDGTFVKNFQEHPQTIILTDSIAQVLQHLHPDGQYCIGQDCGIYWRETDLPEVQLQSRVSLCRPKQCTTNCINGIKTNSFSPKCCIGLLGS